MVDKALMQEMFKAVREGDLAAVKSLVSTHDSLLRAKIPFGTWLHVAASNGKVNLLEYFLEKGIDVNAGGSLSGGTALNDAADEGRLDAVKFLVSRGAQLNFPLPEQNPLFAAIVKGDIETAKFPIKAGIDTKGVYRRASGKKSDAHSFAIERGQKAIAALLQHGDSPASSPQPAGAPHESIIQHMAKHFGPVEELGLQEILPVAGVRINVIHPKKKKDPLILFTTGMSDLAQTVPAGQEAYRYTELMIRLPANWPLNKKLSKPQFYWPVKWLLDLAGYPHQHKTWLGGRMTIVSNDEPPQPIAPKTDLTCMMLLCEQAWLNPISMPDGREVLLYCLVPLYTEERDLEKKLGTAALFERFEKHHISFIVDPRRVNAAIGR